MEKIKNYLRQLTWLAWPLLTAISYIALLSKPAWSDEVYYIDAGANLALGKGFTSTAWLTVPPGATWGSSTPLVPVFFAALFKLFGFGYIQARTGFFALHFLGALLIAYWAGRRYNLGATGVLATYAMLMFFEPIAHALYNPRHDTFALILCAWWLHVVLPNNEEGSPRSLGAAGLGFVSLLVGLHLAAYFAFATATAHLLMPSPARLKIGISMAVGMILAVVSLKLAYTSLGVWDQFLSARYLHYGRQLPWVPVGFAKFTLSREIILMACMMASVGAWTYFRRRDIGLLGPVIFSLACFVAIPVVIACVGIYYINYIWMVALPMAIAIVATASGKLKLAAKWPFAVVVLASFWALGYQLRSRKALLDSHDAALAASRAAAKLSSGTVVASDFPCYYELKSLGADACFTADPARGIRLGVPRELYMPQHIADSIMVCVAGDAAIEGIKGGLGGQWVEVPESRGLVGFKVYRRAQR